MGGISNVVKAGTPKSWKPKDVLKFGLPKEDIKRQKNIWKQTWSAQAAERQAEEPTGATVGAMTAEEQDEIRRRRAAVRRPATTALSADESETLGG